MTVMTLLRTVVEEEYVYIFINSFFFFGFEKTSPPRKAHFVGPGEGVKPQLSQALTRGAHPDSNSRPAVQISNPLPSRYAPWGHIIYQSI
jgi:hypothetical protein